MRIGTTEVLLILLVAFIIFGPSRLPKIGETLGETIRKFRKELDGKDSEADKTKKANQTADDQ